MHVKENKLKYAATSTNRVSALNIPDECKEIEHKTDWRKDTEEMEQYFSNIDLSQTVQLEPCAKIINLDKFIRHHLQVIKAQNGKRVFLPYLERLNKVRGILNSP